MINLDTCDRCDIHDLDVRSYGFGKTDYHLCRLCAKEWEQIIRSEKHQKVFNNPREDWQKYLNKILKEFVEFVHSKKAKEVVEFT